MAPSEEKGEKILRRSSTMSSVEEEVLRSYIGRRLKNARILGRIMTAGQLLRYAHICGPHVIQHAKTPLRRMTAFHSGAQSSLPIMSMLEKRQKAQDPWEALFRSNKRA